MLGDFLELSKLESKKIRLQVLKLVDALEREALDVFRLARRLERTMWTDPTELARHGRSEIVERPAPDVTQAIHDGAALLRHLGTGTISVGCAAVLAPTSVVRSPDVFECRGSFLDEKMRAPGRLGGAVRCKSSSGSYRPSPFREASVRSKCPK